MYLEILDDLKTICQVRINDLDEGIEIKFIFRQKWQRLDSTMEAIVNTKMRELGYGGGKGSGKPSITTVADALITHADENRHNPIKDYFTSLEGKYAPCSTGAYIHHKLAGYFHPTDGPFETWLLKWTTGAIAKIFTGARNSMLVLVGNQRMGKSFFARWLCSPLKHHFLASTINPDSKDAILRLVDTFIWEVEELGSTTRRADVEALKAFITKAFIYERPAYQRYPIHKPVTASFIGTVNYDGTGFLTDPTGSTRFLSCQVDQIDFAYAEEVNVNDLWAEAYWYYKNIPNCWELSEAEKVLQATLNASFELSSALLDVIEAFFDLTPASDDFMSNLEIKSIVELHYRSSSEQQLHNELSRVLTKFGIRKGRKILDDGRQYRGWLGIAKKSLKPPVMLS